MKTKQTMNMTLLILKTTKTGLSVQETILKEVSSKKKLRLWNIIHTFETSLLGNLMNRVD